MGLDPPPGERGLRKEMVFVLEEDRIYSLMLQTNTRDQDALDYRDILLRSLALSKKHPHSALSPVAAFRSLPLERKTGPEGTAYLFAAWAHDRDRADFLRQIFSYAERYGDGEDAPHLRFLYEYAFKKYGNAFFRPRQNPQTLTGRLKGLNLRKRHFPLPKRESAPSLNGAKRKNRHLTPLSSLLSRPLS